jgi:hypothetical protein
MREFSKPCPKCGTRCAVFAILCGRCLADVPLKFIQAVLDASDDREFLRRGEALLKAVGASAEDLRIPRDYRQAVESAPAPRHQCVSCDHFFSAPEMTQQCCRACLDEVPTDIREEGYAASAAWLLNPV